jgi:hypothetical protein
MARKRALGYDYNKSNSVIDLRFQIAPEQFEAMMSSTYGSIGEIIRRVNISEPNDPFYHHTFEYDMAQLDKTYSNIDIRKMTDAPSDEGFQYPTGNSCWTSDGEKLLFLPHTEAQADVRSYYFGIANGMTLESNIPFEGSDDLYMEQDYVSTKFGVSYQIHANVGFGGHNLDTAIVSQNDRRNGGGAPRRSPPNNDGGDDNNEGPQRNPNGHSPAGGNGGIKDDTTSINVANNLKPPQPAPINGSNPRMKLSLHASPSDGVGGVVTSSENKFYVDQTVTNISPDDESKIRKFFGKFYNAGKQAFSNEKNMDMVADLLSIVRNSQKQKSGLTLDQWKELAVVLKEPVPTVEEQTLTGVRFGPLFRENSLKEITMKDEN